MTSNITIERTTQSLGEVNDAQLIEKIFEIKNKKINFLYTPNYIFAVKLLEVNTKKYAMF